MLRNLLILPDGTEIFSGAGAVSSIKSTTITECVNGADDIMIGSVCSNALEMTLLCPMGSVNLTAGDAVELYKVDDSGTRSKVGTFTLDKPTRPTANTMKITGYDNVSKLDKDLSAWLKSLDGWPYDLRVFAGMVCEACGLTFVHSDIPNADYLIPEFHHASATGRKIMQWLGEICCRFTRATVDGAIEFAWYQDSGMEFTPGGPCYYFQNGLAYENYTTEKIDAVQLGLADSESGAPWPVAEEGANSYVIYGNPILMTAVNEGLLPYLDVILEQLQDISYTPCRILIPVTLDVKPGDIIHITDKNGVKFTSYVMTKKTTGQKTELECTGNPRRDSTGAVNNQSSEQKVQSAVSGLSQKAIFDKLTNYGQMQGLYMKDGQIYINASYMRSGVYEGFGENALPPTEDDAIHFLWSVLFPDLYPLPEGYEDNFDLNGDGIIDVDDVLLMQKWSKGVLSQSDIPGAKNVPVTMKLDISNADKILVVEGVNQFGTPVEIILGTDSKTSSFVLRQYLDGIIQQENENGILFRKPDQNDSVGSTNEFFNPPLLAGAEYRTTERYQGKPVYTQVVLYGRLPSSGTRYEAQDVLENQNILPKNIISLHGRCYTDTDIREFPVYMDGTVSAYCWLNEQGIGVAVTKDMSAYKADFVIKYTRD